LLLLFVVLLNTAKSPDRKPDPDTEPRPTEPRPTEPRPTEPRP
jgi:hypothetical protein